MSEIHVQQIRANLKKLFDGLIDLSDHKNAKDVLRESAFNTRALAAFVLYHYHDLEPTAASACITDGTGDNGIDSVHYNGPEQTLTVVQAKWREDGRGSVETGDLHKLIAGFKDLINLRNDRFNTKFAPHFASIKSAVEDANTRFKEPAPEICTGR